MKFRRPSKNGFSKKKRERIVAAMLLGTLLLAVFGLSPDLPLAGRLLGCLFTLGFIVAAFLEDENEPPFIP